MLVLINGLPLFAKRLAKDLSEIDPNVKYVFVNTYYSKWDKLKFLFLMPFAKALISVNGVSDRSLSLDWALFWKKRIILQWMGTDCLLAIERFKNNTINRKYIDCSSSFVDSDWQYEEVKSINIDPVKIWFKYIPESTTVKKYDSIRVLTYVAQSRQAFYGMDKICELARTFPEIQFDVLGVENSEFDYPSNLSILGWKTENEVADLMRTSPIFLRLTEHDGFSVSVTEALSYGCEVIWSFEFEFSHFASTFEQAKLKLAEVVAKIEERGLTPNIELSQKVLDKFGKNKVLTNYAAEIHNVLKAPFKSKKRVLVNGLPLFSKRLVDDLHSLDAKNAYYFADTYYSYWQKIRFLFLLPFTDLVISFNGVSDNSGSLNWVLRFKKKLIMQWQGTDVSLAIDRFNSGAIEKKYINHARHFTDATWLKEELEQVIQPIKIVRFKHLEFSENESVYDNVSVLSYMGQGREAFYGYNEMVEAATHFKSMIFHVIGSDGKDLNAPENIIFHGWISQEEVAALMKKTAIFVRITKHDGNSMSVVEALGNGCEVIWSYPNEKTYLATNSDELISTLDNLKIQIEQKGLIPNRSNFEFVTENFKKEIIIGNYIKEINKFIDEN